MMTRRDRTAPLEWLAAGLGLILTVAMLGIVGWQASLEPDVRLPEIMVEVRDGTARGPIHVVSIIARNRSPATAANVVIEGALLKDGSVVERAQTTFDYVPGNSSRSGGLFFIADPSTHDLRLRALGYVDP